MDTNSDEKLLEEVIKRSLDQYRGKTLPSIKDLAQKFKVSKGAISKTLHSLADQKIVMIKPRKRIQIINQFNEESFNTVLQEHDSSIDKLYKEIKNEIESGDLLSGLPLPKIAFYVVREKMSNKSVQKVYNRLITEKLAYRKGKQVIIGSPLGSPSLANKKPKVILILCDRAEHWSWLCTDFATRSFGQMFIYESKRRNVRLICALTEKQSEISSWYPSGWEKIEQFILENSSNFLGTLAILDRARNTTIELWIQRFLHFKRPIVWLDHKDTGIQSTSTSHVKKSLFTRCCIKEDSIVTTTISYLLEQGHRNALFVYSPSPNETWQDYRLTRLQEISKTNFESQVQITSKRSLSLNDFNLPIESGLIEDIEYLCKNGSKEIKDSIQKVVNDKILKTYSLDQYIDKSIADHPHAFLIGVLHMVFKNSYTVLKDQLFHINKIRASLELLPLFKDKKISIIIGQNDKFSRSQLIPWLDILAIQIPQEISLISFDNLYSDAFIPLTTIDFGYDYLGYQAFHAICGDIPVKRNRQGDIESVNKIIDNGSVQKLVTS